MAGGSLTNGQPWHQMSAKRDSRVAAACVVLISMAFAACAPSPSGAILLFRGSGTSRGDVAAVEGVLNSRHLAYSTAGSSQLNGLSELQLRSYRLLIVPGRNFLEMGNGLHSTTTANIRNAVHAGLNYLGICAGGFLAGETGSNSLNLADGVRFRFYSAESRGIRKAAVSIAVAKGTALDQYWEDGPEFTGWGDVVGKYPDGSPAIVQGRVGSGWVILSGIHAEAPESWRSGMSFRTPASQDHAYAGSLIEAALNGVALPHY